MKLYATLMLRFRPGFIPPAPLNSKIGKYSKDFDNLPERFVFRKSRKLIYKSEDHPAHKPMILFKTPTQHILDRPWTTQYWTKTLTDKKAHGLFVEPIKEEDWMWFRGDRVEIITGKDKGKQGIIKIIVQERNWVYVDGLNLTYEISGNEPNYPGMMISKAEPLLVTTDIKLVDPSDEQAADFEWRFNENGERVRVSVRSGYQLPIPSVASETVDYKAKGGYVENKTKDTPAKDVEEITYVPKLGTFDMDIMNVMGIVENRKPTRTYWY